MRQPWEDVKKIITKWGVVLDKVIKPDCLGNEDGIRLTGRCPRGRTSPSWAEGAPKASPSPPTRPPKEVCLSLRLTVFHNLKFLKFFCHLLPIILYGYVAQILNASNCTNVMLLVPGSIHFIICHPVWIWNISFKASDAFDKASNNWSLTKYRLKLVEMSLPIKCPIIGSCAAMNYLSLGNAVLLCIAWTIQLSDVANISLQPWNQLCCQFDISTKK